MRGGTQGSTFAKASDFAKATSDKTADGLSGIEDGDDEEEEEEDMACFSRSWGSARSQRFVLALALELTLIRLRPALARAGGVC